MSHIRISPTRPGRAKIELNGYDISKGVRSFIVSQSVGEAPLVELELIGYDGLDLEAVDPRAVVRLTGDNRKVLERLGWTPPENEHP